MTHSRSGNVELFTLCVAGRLVRPETARGLEEDVWHLFVSEQRRCRVDGRLVLDLKTCKRSRVLQLREPGQQLTACTVQLEQASRQSTQITQCPWRSLALTEIFNWPPYNMAKYSDFRSANSASKSPKSSVRSGVDWRSGRKAMMLASMRIRAMLNWTWEAACKRATAGSSEG